MSPGGRAVVLGALFAMFFLAVWRQAYNIANLIGGYSFASAFRNTWLAVLLSAFVAALFTLLAANDLRTKRQR
jgi:glucan phosphoethanolaminetransferase (alkaline phosphatase superfamily)